MTENPLAFQNKNNKQNIKSPIITASQLQSQQSLFWQIFTESTGYLSLCRKCSIQPFKHMRTRLFHPPITTRREGRLQRTGGHGSLIFAVPNCQILTVLAVPHCFTAIPSARRGQIIQLPSYLGTHSLYYHSHSHRYNFHQLT